MIYFLFTKNPESKSDKPKSPCCASSFRDTTIYSYWYNNSLFVLFTFRNAADSDSNSDDDELQKKIVQHSKLQKCSNPLNAPVVFSNSISLTGYIPTCLNWIHSKSNEQSKHIPTKSSSKDFVKEHLDPETISRFRYIVYEAHMCIRMDSSLSKIGYI